MKFRYTFCMNPVLALIFANIIWGVAPPIFKFALTAIPPFTLAFIRFFFAALLFIPFLKKWQPMTFSDWIQVIIGSFFGISINIAFFFLGLQTSAASINVTIIGSAGPVFLYFISIFFLKETPNRKILFGMMIALTGVLIIILSPFWLHSAKVDLGQVKGNIFFMIATMGAVLYPVICKRVLSKINVYQITFIGFLVGAVSFFPFMLKELTTWKFTQIDTPALVGVLFGVFFSSFLAYLFFNIGISKIKIQEIGLYSYIDPVASMLVAAPLLHEFPGFYLIIGTVLVIGGIFVSEGRIQYHPFFRLFSKSPARQKTKKYYR